MSDEASPTRIAYGLLRQDQHKTFTEADWAAFSAVFDGKTSVASLLTEAIRARLIRLHPLKTHDPDTCFDPVHCVLCQEEGLV